MQSIEAYIECHYFASGFKSKFFGKDNRPKYLPDADSVGLHNEALLKGKDYAVEITRREVGGRKLTWLGVYMSAKDSGYGDRGNYCGVGTWLVNCAPVHSSLLLKGLLNLCEILADNGLSSNFESDVSTFNDEYLNGYLIPDQWVPVNATGMPYFKDRYDSSKYKQIATNDDASLALISNTIRLHCISKHDQEYNRALYFVGNASKITAPTVFELTLSEDITKSEDTLKSILYETSGRVAEDNKLLIDNNTLNEVNAKLTFDVNNLTEKLSKVRQENESLIKANEDLNRKNNAELSQKSFFPTQQREPNQFSSSNNPQLTQIQSTLSYIQNQIGRLDSTRFQHQYPESVDSTSGGIATNRKRLILAAGLMLTLLIGILIGYIIFKSRLSA